MGRAAKGAEGASCRDREPEGPKQKWTSIPGDVLVRIKGRVGEGEGKEEQKRRSLGTRKSKKGEVGGWDWPCNGYTSHSAWRQDFHD